jgi:class 3 adenylate cyclase
MSKPPGSLGRLIHFDRRGTGLSDPVPLDKLPDFETQVEDAVAILDAAGSSEPAVIGLNEGTMIAALLAAGYAERCRSLVLFTGAVRHARVVGMPKEAIDPVIAKITEDFAIGRGGVEILAPSRQGDQRFEEQLARFQRNSVRPGAIGHYVRQSMEGDVRGILGAIQASTLVLNRTGNLVVPVELSREAASLIPDARFIELPGTDHLVYSQDPDVVVDEIEEFLTGSRTQPDRDRVLATVLFTDIVDSTRHAAEMGDRRWRDLLDEHHRVVRAELERYGGQEINTAGDGFLATFKSPRRAIECAGAAAEAIRPIGLDIRAGVHTGELELSEGDVRGIAVHIGARIGALANGREVLVSGTVKDLLAGSNIVFEDRGEHQLKGVPGTWRVFAVTA